MTRLIRRHHSGRLATLYEGETNLGKRVAVKQLSQQLRDNPPLRDRLFQAAHLWAKLPHDHLVEYIDVDRDKAWIVSAWQPSSLESLHRCSTEQGVNILWQSLAALRELNSAGYFHGNIKPSNILLGSQGDVKLCDGLMLSVSEPGVIPSDFASPKYLAPELTGSATPGPGTDLYALAFAIVEAMSGDRFRGFFPGISADAEASDMAWIQWHTNLDEHLPPCADVTGCPSEVGAVLDRMLSKDPHSRFRFAEQVLAALPPQDSVAVSTSQSLSLDQPPSQPVDNRERRDEEATGARPMLSDILARPHHPIVLVVASGPEAGNVFDTDAHSFEVGFEEDCDLTLKDLVGHGQDDFRLRIHCGNEGWTVSQLMGNGFFVNQSPVRTSSVLRSGDIVRCSWQGPDFQFYLQSGTPNLSDVVARYVKPNKKPAHGEASGAPARGTSDSPTGKRTNAPRPPQQGGRRQPATAPSRPNMRKTMPVHGGYQATPQPSAPHASVPTHSAAPSPPRRPVPTRDRSAHAPHAPQAPLPPGGATDSNAMSANDSGASPSGSVVWTQPSTWDKPTKDKVLIGSALLIAVLAIFLVPTGKRDEERETESPAQAVVEEASTESSVEAAAEVVGGGNEGSDANAPSDPNLQ